APLRGCDGSRDARAERGGEHVPLEGAEGAHPARGAADPLVPARASAGVGLAVRMPKDIIAGRGDAIHWPPVSSRSSTTRLMCDPLSCSWKPSSPHICNMAVFSANTSPYTRRSPFSLA